MRALQGFEGILRVVGPCLTALSHAADGNNKKVPNVGNRPLADQLDRKGGPGHRTDISACLCRPRRPAGLERVKVKSPEMARPPSCTSFSFRPQLVKTP